MGIIKEVEEFVPPYTEEQLLNQRTTPKQSDKPAPIERIDVVSETIIAVDANGKYVGKYTGVPIPEGTFPVSEDTDSAYRVWDFETETWGEHVPPTPVKVSKKALISQFRDDGILTQAEALAFLGRSEIPAAFTKALGGLTQTERDDAEIDLISDTEVMRDSKFISALEKSLKYKTSKMDSLFVAASVR